ncbi:tetratricopeptide repeat protein [Streptomyces antimicrobicus]|uniref:Tetratricopeptide repeat protein n=1 Tax=Streptomyces antimicrobicus TaxID=2883108 RepID=A0ABS8BFD1_9ACTN|nr:tetratricopeptide repeat protein [Streptomyces antimicrobicus]MCB5183228.1 tetratricopeptide repeat protein [Streptomyces antimicrobicus]
MSGTLDRAEAYLDLGRYQQAAALASQHLAQQPDDASALLVLARCQRHLEDLPAGLASVDQALRITPDAPFAWMLRADTLSRMGRHHEAVAAAQRCVEYGPLFWWSHHTLALVLERSGNGALRRDGYAAALRATELGPQEASAHFMLGLIAHRLGDHRTARAAYGTTLRLDPQSSEAHNNLAMLDQRRSWSSRRAWSRAAEGFVTSASLDVEDTHARFNLEGMAWGVAASARWCAFAGMAVALVSTQGGRSGGQDGGGPAGPLVGALLLVLMWGAWFLWQRSRMTPRVRRTMALVARGCPPVLVMAAAVALPALHSLVTVVSAVALPAVDTGVLAACAGLLFWNLILTYWISRVFLGRRAPGRRARRGAGGPG